jgi:glycosyltransferase involved in cell wall biosynthesis
MTEAAFVIPGDLDQPTGGYAYDRRVLALLPQFGVRVRHLALPASFPHPTAADLEASEQKLQAAAPAAVLLIDGLAFGAMPAGLIDRLHRPVVALVHHPLWREAGLGEARQEELRVSETAALARARSVIVTSRSTADTLREDFAVPAGKITVAEPGTDPSPRAHGSAGDDGPHLIAVGAVVPRKAYHVLVAALAPLAHLPWRLTIAGPTDRSAEAVAQLRASLHAAKLEHRASVVGALAPGPLDRLYASADIFVMSSLYEGYGMVLAEAMARGLPIITTTGGAAAATVPDGAALKVAPGDAEALSGALRRLLTDSGLRARLAEASWRAGQRLPRWEDAARRIAGVIEEVARRQGERGATGP